MNLEMIKAKYAVVCRRTPGVGFGTAAYWNAEEKARAAKTGRWVQGHK